MNNLHKRIASLSPTQQELLIRRFQKKGGLFSDIPILRQNRPSDGLLPLSFSQERLWFLSQLRTEGAEYNLRGALRLLGALDMAAVEASLAEIVARHETLRTTFELQDGQPYQVVHLASAFTLQVVELTSTSEPEQAAQEWLSAEAQRPFDLAIGPLWRAALLDLGEEDHILSLTLHHIIGDGWSVGVFV